MSKKYFATEETHQEIANALKVMSNNITYVTGPKGDKGDKGDTGSQGPQGEMGPVPNITIGNVVSGNTPSATITGTPPNPILNLVLPKGDKGDTGNTGPTGPVGPKGDPGVILPRVEITSSYSTALTITAIQDEVSLVPIDTSYDEETGIRTYIFELTHFGLWTFVITDGTNTNNKYLRVENLTTYYLDDILPMKRYGYRISKSESNPSTRVEYLYDAVGMDPAYMDFNTGEFHYGDWENVWFVQNNKPLMLRSDGTIDYYLDPNDYTKKEDGTASDVANTSYDGNAMSQIPLVYVYRYQDSSWEYEIISDVQIDSNYKAYAHTRADGTIADYFYYAMFRNSIINNKMRSLADQSLSRNTTAQQEVTAATANGMLWYTGTWSQYQLIRTLCILMGKSTASDLVFGNGNCCSGTEANLLSTGTLKNKGQFYGYSTSNANKSVKVFHIEDFWGNQWQRLAGFICNNGRAYVKMTREGSGYQITSVSGYVDTGINIPNYTSSAFNGKYISGGTMNEYGFFPTAASGSTSTYYSDGMWGSVSNQLTYLFVSAGAGDAPGYGGCFPFRVYDVPSAAFWNLGAALSCEMPAV